MSRSIKLTWTSSDYTLGTDDAIRVRIEAACAEGVTTKIFAYRLLPADPYGAENGTFSHICSPVDLEEYPADEPGVTDSPQWFRLSYVDVLVRSTEEAEDFVEVVRSDVRRLVASLNRTDTLYADGEELVGTPDCDPAPSSASATDSSSSSSASVGSGQVLTEIGTFDNSTGPGVEWEVIGTGAGSPFGSSESSASAGLNRSQVTLCERQSSQMLTIQGFDFSSLPDSAIIDGIRVSVSLRDPDGNTSSSSSSASLAATCPRLAILNIQHPTLGIGNNAADFDCVEGPAWADYQSGHASDLWGLSNIPVATLKDGAFGIGIVVVALAGTNDVSVEVDGASVTVYYREVYE